MLPAPERPNGQVKKLEDLFHDTLKDIYFAEKKILASLPKMTKAAQHADLKAAFEKHTEETKAQIVRLEDVFAEIGKKPQGNLRCYPWYHKGRPGDHGGI